MSDVSVISDIRGFRLSGSMDGLTVTAGPGVCYSPASERIINPGVLSAVVPNPVAGFVHAYVRRGANRMANLMVSYTGPDDPYLGTARTMVGDPSARYLGSGLIWPVTLKLRPGRHVQVLAQGSMVMFDMATAAGSKPFNLLDALTSTSVQKVSLTSVVPATSQCARIQVINKSNRMIYVGLESRGTVGKNNHLFEVAPGASPLLDVPLDPDRSFTLVQTTDSLLGVVGAILSGSSTINCAGYYFDR